MCKQCLIKNCAKAPPARNMVNLDVLFHTPIWELWILKYQSEVKFEIMIFNNLSDFEIVITSTTVVCQQVDNILQQNQRAIIHCIIMSNVLKVQKNIYIFP